MEGLIGYLLFAGFAAWIAARLGRTAWRWFLVSIVISPIFSLIVLLIIRRPKGSEDLEDPWQQHRRRAPDE